MSRIFSASTINLNSDQIFVKSFKSFQIQILHLNGKFISVGQFPSKKTIFSHKNIFVRCTQDPIVIFVKNSLIYKQCDQIWQNFAIMAIFSIGQKIEPALVNLLCTLENSFFANGLILTKNLVIWSHFFKMGQSRPIFV